MKLGQTEKYERELLCKLNSSLGFSTPRGNSSFIIHSSLLSVSNNKTWCTNHVHVSSNYHRYNGDEEESGMSRYRLTHHLHARYELIFHLGAYISNLKKLHHFRRRSKV